MMQPLDSPSLALIHGWGLGRTAWQPIVTPVSAYCDVHHVDLPGYGGAAPDPSRFEDTARRIVDSLPAGTILCGWSLGALLALEAASQRPEHIGGLVLVGASPCFVQHDDWPHAQLPTLLDGFTAAVRNHPVETLQRFVALLNQGDARARANTRAQQQALAAHPTPDTDSLIQGLDWLRKTELRQKVATITIPTLLIHGESDPLMPLPAARWLAEHLPQARLEVFHGAAHAPFLNSPERFAELLIEYCHAAPAHQATRP